MIKVVWSICAVLVIVCALLTWLSGHPEPLIGGTIGALWFAGLWTVMELLTRKDV